MILPDITADESEENIMGKHKKKGNNKKITKEVDSTGTYYVVPKSTLVVIVAIGSAVLGIIGWLAVQVYSLNGAMSKMSDVPAKVEAMNTAINGDGSRENPGINARLTLLENANKSVINASDSTTASMSEISVESNSVSRTSAPLDSSSVLGTNVEGKQCITSDYVNETILLTYKENDKEIYFLGQFNENYHWDGYCIINAYHLDGTLYGICESNYKDGEKVDYESFVQEENTDNWIYSKRKCEEGYNTGINKTYQYVSTDKKSFTQENARFSDVLTVEPYLQEHYMALKSEYTGRTSEGIYNDTTGNAYYISFYKDQSVKTLYQGNVIDGKFDDDSGQAWQIACNRENNTKYLYYCGIFEDGSMKDKGNSNRIQVDLSQNDIQKILQEKNCTLDLQWDETSTGEEGK